MKWIAVPIGLGVWGAYLTVGALTFAHFQPQKWSQNIITGNGNVKKETRNIGEFESITIGSAMQGKFTESKPGPLTIEAESNILPLISTRVEGKRLIIEMRGNISTSKAVSISGSASMIKALQASGASNVSMLKVRAHPIEIHGSGASRIVVDGIPNDLRANLSGASVANFGRLELKSLIVDLSGASRLSIAGTTQKISARLGGASTLEGKLKAISGEVEASGASNVSISNSSSIKSRLSGFSKLR